MLHTLHPYLVTLIPLPTSSIAHWIFCSHVHRFPYFPQKYGGAQIIFIRMLLTGFCTVHVLYQVVHDYNLCGHLLSTPEISLSDAYAKLVVSLNNYCRKDTYSAPPKLFKWCILLISLHWYCVWLWVQSDYVVLHLLRRHWLHILYWHWHCRSRYMHFGICLLYTSDAADE